MIHNIKFIFLSIVLFLAMALCISIFSLHTLDLFGRENFVTYIIFFVGNALFLGGGGLIGEIGFQKRKIAKN